MQIITTTAALEDLYENITAREVSAVAIDTEFFRVDSYWPKLSLIQLGVGKDVYLIDALAPGLDLTRLGYLLNNPAIKKIIHSGRQDFEIFFNVFKALPINIFDTQVAAYLIGCRDSMGLADLLKEKLGVTLDKSDQYTNWLKRPLTPQQLHYAANDVIWLVELHNLLEQELKNLGRSSWLFEEQEFLLKPETYFPDVMNLWKKVRFDKKSKPLMRLILQTLCAWREDEAKRLDWNRGRVMSDKILVDLVLTFPESLEALRSADLPLNQDQRNHIWHLIQQAKHRPRDTWPNLERKKLKPKLTQDEVVVLHKHIADLAERLNVDQRLLISNEELKSIIHGLPKGRFVAGWRLELFGNKIQSMFSKMENK